MPITLGNHLFSDSSDECVFCFVEAQDFQLEEFVFAKAVGLSLQEFDFGAFQGARCDLLPVFGAAQDRTPGDDYDVQKQMALVPMDAWVFEFAKRVLDQVQWNRISAQQGMRHWVVTGGWLSSFSFTTPYWGEANDFEILP